MSQPLSGRVAIVTGASRGIGKGIALQLGEAGATVYITGRTMQPDGRGTSLMECAEEIEKRGGKCIPVQCDHEKDEDIKKLFEKVKQEQNGQLDILVNNAYKAVKALVDAEGKKFYTLPPELWDDVNNVGLRNHYICSVYAARIMAPQKKGLIVNISSPGGLNYMINAAYGVGKVACDRMAADCAAELKKDNVAFVSLWPGAVRTENIKDMLNAGPRQDVDRDEAMAGGMEIGPETIQRMFEMGETPEFAGKAVVHLAADPNIMKRSGKILIAAEMGEVYGFKDIDGVLTFVNCANVRWVTRVQDAFAYAGVAACVMVIISGVVNVVITGEMHVFQSPFKGTNPDMGRAALALYPGLYAFAGWDMLNFITEEIKNPHKNLPRAIWISMPIVTVLYILINISMYSVLSAQQVLESEAVAVTYAEKAMGVVSWTIPILVAMTTIGGINAYILAVSRLYFVGSREGHLPQVLSMINIWAMTPAPAVLFNGFLVCCYLISDDVLTLINYFSFMYWIGVGLSIAALLYLRWKQPDMHRPIKVHLALPVLFLLASLFLVVVPFYSAFRDSVIGCAIFLSGVPVYYFGVHRKVHPAWLHTISDGITRKVQKLLLCVPQETEDTTLPNGEGRHETEKTV